MSYALAAVALVLSVVQLVRSKGQSLTDWAILCLALALGALAVFRV